MDFWLHRTQRRRKQRKVEAQYYFVYPQVGSVTSAGAGQSQARRGHWHSRNFETFLLRDPLGIFIFSAAALSLAPFGLPKKALLHLCPSSKSISSSIQDVSPRQYYPLHSRPPLSVIFVFYFFFFRHHLAFASNPARAAGP